VLSVAPVRSAGGAASYFAKDDYYVGEHSSEVSAWGGLAAAELGLVGEVDKLAFENLLNGRLPDGEQVGDPERRRAGMDLTFSMPKSASVLAYVGGDQRLLDAHMQAVRQTMGWVEKNFAEGRVYTENPKGDPVQTGNLAYAVFQHDTSRKLDPQAHLHVVIANLTKVGERWQALHNDQLWKNNSIIGSVYHAALRTLVEELGYRTELTGKHGQFEVEGVPASVIREFSQRRVEVLAKAAEIGIATPQGRDAVVVRTRDAKVNLEDRGALRAEWGERADGLRFDGQAQVAEAQAQAADSSRGAGGLNAMRQIGSVVAQWAERLSEWLGPGDPLVTTGIARLGMSASQLGAEMAVASAIRILGQREAAFPIHEVSRTALDLGIKGVTIEAVEARVRQLADKGQLVFGKSARSDGAITHVTTPEHIAEERRLLAGIDAGRDIGQPIMAADVAATRLQDKAGERPLGQEQLDAGILALSSSDRVVVIQGVAGAGKTTLISAIAAALGEDGKEVLGLAQANKMVSMLKDEARIPAQTLSSFVNDHLRGAMAGKGEAFETSKASLQDTVLVLDEASLVANKQMNDLVAIANTLGVSRLVMIGDRAQLQPIDAGTAFSLVQAHRPAMARMDVSLRQRTEHMKSVAALTRTGHFGGAFRVLGERVQSAGVDFREAAARKWLELSAEDRTRTALYASGRETRALLNDFVQGGLKAEGTLRGEGLELARIESVNVTREELRYARTYRAGQLLDVSGNARPGGLERGQYRVVEITKTGRVVLRDEDGRRHSFRPDRLDPGDKRESLTLSERETIRIHEGERVRWTANDKARGMFNSAGAEIIGITREGVEVRTSEGVNMLLAHGDRMLSRMGLAYAINMHQAQGMTTDQGIGVMHSAERQLSSQRLTHVMATRVRDDITIFTNDRDQLLRSIEANPGDKASALEQIGEKAVDLPGQADRAAKGAGEAASMRKTDRADPFAIDPASLRVEPEKHGSAPKPQLTHVPEKTIELGL
jgi:conjugative relaxase-like TrwC/TraI family protein